MVLVSIPLGGWFDGVVNNETNYQFTLIIVMYFINSTGVC